MHRKTICLIGILLVLVMNFGLSSCFLLAKGKRGEGKIVYSMKTLNDQENGDNYEIYIMDEDGSNQTRLTFSEDIDEAWPTISPDGSKIAFVCQSPQSRKTNAYGRGLLSIMGIDGEKRQDFSIIAETPFFSEDGSRINYYLTQALMSVRTDGTNEEVLFKKSGPIGSYYLVFSVTDTGFVFFDYNDMGDVHLFTANFDGTDLRQITDFEGGLAGYIILSPNGRQIALQTVVDRDRDHPERGLCLIDLESGAVVRLTESHRSSVPAFSPDGSTVYYLTTTPEGYTIYSIGTDGKSNREVTKIEKMKSDYATYRILVSEDGKRIFFLSDGKLFRCEKDGSNLVQLTEENIIDPRYAWIPN